MKKRLLALLLVLALTLALAACGGGGGTATPTPGGGGGGGSSTPAPGGNNTPAPSDPEKLVEITAALSALPNSCDTVTDDTNTSVSVMYLVFDHLVEFDDVDLHWKPCIAKSWTQVDELTMEFEIRDDVIFSNGDKVTMDDVVFSIMRLKDIAKSAAVGALIGSVTYEGQTLTLKINEPNVTAIQQILWTTVIVNKAYLESGGDAALNLEPVGTGPYKVAEFTPGASVVLETWDGYHSEKPQIDRINFTAIPENASRYIAVETGHVQYAGLVTAFEIELAEQAGDFNIINQPSNRHCGFLLNTESAVFSNVNVRRAMAYALDRESMCSLSGGRPELRSFLFGTFDIYYESPNMPEFDIDKAKELFEAEGISPASPVKVTLTHYQSDPAIEYYQSTLAPLGVEIVLNTVEFSVFQAAEKSGEFDMMWIGGRNMGGSPIMDLERFDSRFKGTRNNSRYDNPEMDALIDQARVTLDPVELKKITDQINDIAAQDVPLLPLYLAPSYAVLDKNLTGVTIRGDAIQSFRYAVYNG